jgi:DNA-binding NarL/FixJ family response regulator
MQIMVLVGFGKTNLDIAADVEVSEATVVQHRKALCRKLGLHSAAELVVNAARRSMPLVGEHFYIVQCLSDLGLTAPQTQMEMPFSWPVLSEVDELSRREKEVLRLAGCGKTIKEIAARLCLSVETIAQHRKRLCRKLGIHSRVGLTAYAAWATQMGTGDQHFQNPISAPQ